MVYLKMVNDVLSPKRSLSQPKAKRVCIRSKKKSNHLLFPFLRAFSFQGHTIIALKYNVQICSI